MTTALQQPYRCTNCGMTFEHKMFHQCPDCGSYDTIPIITHDEAQLYTDPLTKRYRPITTSIKLVVVMCSVIIVALLLIMVVRGDIGGAVTLVGIVSIVYLLKILSNIHKRRGN